MSTEITPVELRLLVGKRIRFLRKTKGWTQEELGEYSDLSYKFIGEIERGAVNPSLDTLLGISIALKVEISKLFSNERMCVLTEIDVEKVKVALSSLQVIFESK